MNKLIRTKPADFMKKVIANTELSSSGGYQSLSILRNLISQLINKYKMPVRLILVHKAGGDPYLALRPKVGYHIKLPEDFYTDLTRFSYQRRLKFSLTVVFRNEVPQIKIKLDENEGV